jgi:hypothetical protein
MVTSRLELKKQRGITLVIPVLALLVLTLMPAASAYTATLVSPTNINNVHNGDLVSIQVNGLVENDVFQFNLSSPDLNTRGGTFSMNNFAMPFGFVNGTASTLLIGDNLNASGLQLVVARADGVTITQQNQTTANPYRIFLTHDILKTSYNVSITGYPQSSAGAIIDFSVLGDITTPNNPTFLNFTISNIQSGHLRLRVNDGATNQLDSNLTITNLTSTVGIYRNGVFYLRNSNTGGNADTTFGYGNVAGDIPVVGDWNGNLNDTIGIYRNGVFYLRNSNTNGIADTTFVYGNLAGDTPVAGDWNADGIDTIGVYRSSVFYLRNSNTNGIADLAFTYGQAGDVPVIGDWTGI